MPKILLLEDEDAIRGFIRVNLKRNGFTVVEASTGEEALKKADSEPDLMLAVLDIMLPGIDGFSVCQILRQKYPHLGIIMLTAKGQEVDKINGLVLGADDYIVKPFSPNELIARVQALIRRLNTPGKPAAKNTITSGPFTINLDELKFYKDGQEIDLTPKEFDILKLFIKNPRKALSRNDLLDHVWGKNYIGDLKIVDVNISRIRQKIEDNPAKPRYIDRVWGYGYRWQEGT